MPRAAFELPVFDVVFDFRGRALLAAARSRALAAVAGRSARLVVLRAGRFAVCPGLAITPVMPLGTAAVLAPAVAVGIGLAADLAACATVVTAARIT